MFGFNKKNSLYSEIDGWQADAEADLLIEYASKAPRNGTIVEIGSWKGKSTLCLLKGAKRSKVRVVAIDTFRGSEEHGDVDTYSEFNNNINKYTEYKNIEVIRKTSENANEDWHGAISLLFIDGSHEYEDVKKDFYLWEKFVEKDGYILFHDSFPQGHPDVQLFIIKHLYNRDDYNFIKAVHSISVFKKEPRKPKKQLMFDLGGPLHNFKHYVIGLANRKVQRTGKYPDEVFSPEGNWNWAVTEHERLRLPFISYKSRYIRFYLGWLPRGNFGVKFSLGRKN